MTGNGEKLTDDGVIRNFIPTIAETWQKTITVSKFDYENRFKQFLRMYEVLLKSMAAILYGRVRYYHSHVPEIERLKGKPTLGRFLRFNHACRKVLRKKSDPWIQELEHALSEKLTEQAVIHVCHTTMADLKEDAQWNKQTVAVRELFTILLELRNRTEHDAPPRKIFKDLDDDLYLTFMAIFRALRNILEDPWYAIQTSRTLPDRNYHYEMREFCGINENLKEIATERHLIEERLYAYDQRLDPPWIALWPIAHWDETENKIYLYNGFIGNKNAVFVDHTAAKKPLHLQEKTFEALFNIPSETSEPFEDEKTPVEPAEGERVSESDTGDPAAAAMILKGKNGYGDQDESLIFVSYACADDQPPPDTNEGWVTTLINRLKKQLDVKLGYEVKIDYPLNGNIQATSEILDAIPQTALLIVILSPNYVDSDWCRGAFLRMMKERVRHSSVFVIERNQLEDIVLPPEFDEVTDYCYDFYVVDREEGYPRVLRPNLQQDMHRYNNLVTRLNRDLAGKLQKLHRQQKHVLRTDKQHSQGSGDRHTVFLAGATDDLEEEREKIKCSLTEIDIQVIPEICYFNEPDAFEKAVSDDLVKSDLFVQLLGPRPGKKPPGLPQGYVCRQYELAQEAGKQIMQWHSPELDLKSIHDSDWRDFLEHKTVRAIELDEFTPAIVKKLTPAQPSEKGKKPGKKPPMIFIDVYYDDLVLAQNLCQIFDKLGAGYFLPLQSDKPSENREAFEQYVLHCDATMIVYGDVTPKWVSDQVLAVHKISWQREQGLAPVILDGPPGQKPPGQKPPVTFKLPGMEILQCRNHLDEQQLGNFIQTIQVG